MTSILSTISANFAKSLILGALAPVVVFLALVLVLVRPLLPVDWTVFRPLASLDTAWEATVFLLVATVLSLLLYNLNIPIIRLYEGYPWKEWGIGQRWCSHFKGRLEDLQARRDDMRTLLDTLPKEPEYKSHRTGAQHHLDKLSEQLNTEWPPRASAVLPTRLGNVIRSFETYPGQQYGMEAITLWPRLVAKIDKDYAPSIDDAKTAFDFMLNGSILSVLLTVLTVSAGVIFGTPAASAPLTVRWILQSVAFALLAYFLYRGSIGRARAWGGMVKGAFDLYRWALLDQLGYKSVPRTKPEERDLWQEISHQMLRGDYRPNRPWAAVYQKPREGLRFQAPEVTADHHENLPLIVARGVGAESEKELVVTIGVRNADEERRAENVVVRETVPAGFDYKWASACVTIGSVAVTGTNPYNFRLSHVLPPGEEVALIYRAIRRPE